jgi:probable F420-dependent oxidoreductase
VLAPRLLAAPDHRDIDQRNAVKIGLNFQLTDTTPHAAELARKCEALGFESMFVNEHVVFPVQAKTPYLANPKEPIPEYYPHFADPFISIAIAAAVTQRLKVGTCISLVAEHEPIALAKEIATLDHFCGGRVLFGVGAGWLKEEAEVMGVEFGRRWEFAVEYLRAMKELWTRPEASFDGNFVKFPPVKCYPKPFHKPHTPIHIGAGGLGTSAIERALRHTVMVGDGWMPAGLKPDGLKSALATLRRMCEEAGRDFNAIEISMCVAQMKKSAAREAIDQYGDAGAHRVIPIVGGADFEKMPDIVERVADAFLG